MDFTPAERHLVELWERHMRGEMLEFCGVQLGLIDPSSLPVAGAETARKTLDPGRRATILPRYTGSREA